MIPKVEICPYFGKEERVKWHRERGITDPKSSWGTDRDYWSLPAGEPEDY
jgi:hypothetical protein